MKSDDPNNSMEATQIAVIQNELKNITGEIQELKSTFKIEFEKMYLELKSMYEKYARKEEVMRLENQINENLATKEELRSIRKDIAFNQKIIFGTVIAIIGILINTLQHYINIKIGK